MIFTDRVFLAWYSPSAVAAALPAGNLAFTMVCFPLGIAAYVNTFVAQYHGADRPERIGVAVWQAVFIGLVAAPLAMATIPFADDLISKVGHTTEVTRYEIDYYQAVCWGESTLVVIAALSAFFTGRGAVLTVMVVDSSAAALNVLLDWLLIFGHWGFEEMGPAVPRGPLPWPPGFGWLPTRSFGFGRSFAKRIKPSPVAGSIASCSAGSCGSGFPTACNTCLRSARSASFC